MKKLFSLLVLLTAISAVAAPPPLLRNRWTTNAAPTVDAATTATNLQGNELTRNAYFVNGAVGSDSNDGSSGSPWATIAKAEATAVVGSTVYIASSSYPEQITRGGVIYEFSEGADVISTDANTPVVRMYAATNYIIRGKGSFRNTAGGVVFSNFDGVDIHAADLEFEGRFVRGECLLYVDSTRKNKISFSGEPWLTWFGRVEGLLSAAGGFEADIQFSNVRMRSASAGDYDVSINVPFVVVGCVAAHTPSANGFRIGTWLVNTNLPTSLTGP